MVAEYLIVKGQIKSPRMLKMSLPDISARKGWNQRHAPVVEKLDTLLAGVSHSALIVKKTIHQGSVPPARSHVFCAKLVSSNSNIDDIIPSTNAPPAAPDSAINHSNNTFSTNHSLHRQPQQRIVVDGRSCVSPRPTPGRAKGNQPQEGDTKQKTVIRLKQQSEGSFSCE
ncbi:zinc finger protein-like [Oryza sativa Japonica Group]|uniref:Zinc finger protein-like n=1 Tax=Oryza sativa subsp. japonica TaxID=39947 RepID=Q5JJX5_ORYSJ|nr:zinc finger protein-like [Oryza sativa Japonica Group]